MSDAFYPHRVFQACLVNRDPLVQEASGDQKAVKVSRESQPLAHAPPQRERRGSQDVMADKGHRGHQACQALKESLATEGEMEKR